MSFWKKKSKTVFVRNEAGKVIATQHLGDRPKESKTPVSKALMKQYYEKHPEKTKRAKAGRVGKKLFDTGVKIGEKVDKYAVGYAKSQRGKPMPPLGSYSFANNFNPIGDTFDKGRPKQKQHPQSSKKYVVIGGKAYPKAGASKKKKKTGKSGGKRRKYNPNDPFDFPDLSRS